MTDYLEGYFSIMIMARNKQTDRIEHQYRLYDGTKLIGRFASQVQVDRFWKKYSISNRSITALHDEIWGTDAEAVSE